MDARAAIFHDDYRFQQSPGTRPVGPTLASNKVTYNATTPRAVLTWYPSEDITVYGSYGQGFRSGISQTSALLRLVGSAPVPQAEPDKLHNYELGAKLDLLEKRLSFEGALYYLDW